MKQLGFLNDSLAIMQHIKRAEAVAYFSWFETICCPNARPIIFMSFFPGDLMIIFICNKLPRHSDV